jgi:o-succinylbenzoate synthase
MKLSFQKYQLQFKKPVLTSRGSMAYKNGYYITIERQGVRGVGECSYIEGLSIDRLDRLEERIHNIGQEIEEMAAHPDSYGENTEELIEDMYNLDILPGDLAVGYPALLFGLETALLDLANGGKHEVVRGSAFYQGRQAIPINGLVWMGSDEFMQQQIEQKLADGFRCIKIKVGAIDFIEECRLIENIRKRYTPDQIEIRLDANGAFTEQNVRERLRILSQYTIHSIEQPVKPQQYLLMHRLCAENIIPIALDEELIGTDQVDMRRKLLETIRPQYIILKPSLLGGFASCDEWIELANELNIGWWATSALEGNIGLNAIAQWVAAKMEAVDLQTVQGLGTGSLYIDNVESPLYIESGHLKYNPDGKWA